MGLRQHRGGQLKGSAAVCVQQGAEHTGRVERRAAMPVDGAVGSDQGHAVQVTDQPMLRNGQVARTPSRPRPRPGDSVGSAMSATLYAPYAGSIAPLTGAAASLTRKAITAAIVSGATACFSTSAGNMVWFVGVSSN
jgi:hypothetical protein